jgi:hypothetical protein
MGPGILSGVKQEQTPPKRNVISRIFERSYAKGVIRPTAGSEKREAGVETPQASADY